VIELRLEGGAVAAPPGEEQQFRVAQAGSLVVQPKAIEFRIRHG
jgi:hypothetical protein